jgi:pyrroline-5-carboxylate reductase
MTVGIIGVGHMAGFLVSGLRRAGLAEDILLSPRNAARARRLADEFDCRVADDNQRVADRAECLFLCLRPSDAAPVLRQLRLRNGQLVISVAAGISLSALAPPAAPARLVTAMPVSAAEIGESPTLVFPDDDEARRILSLLGRVIVMPDESVFAAASANAGLYGWLFGLMAALEAENRAAGLSAEQARDSVAGTFRAAAGVALAQRGKPLETLLAGLATKGGITAEGLAYLEQKDAIRNWRHALGQIIRRLRCAKG